MAVKKGSKKVVQKKIDYLRFWEVLEAEMEKW